MAITSSIPSETISVAPIAASAALSTKNEQDSISTVSVMNTPAGTIESTATEGGAKFSISHPGGSNLSFADGVTSEFVPEKRQSLVLGDSYQTVGGDQMQYVKGTHELRVAGDNVTLMGGSDVLSLSEENAHDRFFDAVTPMVLFDSQEQTNINELTLDNYSINTVYDRPSGPTIVCPDLLDGSAIDNQNENNMSSFEAKMMKTGEDKAKKIKVEQDKIYSNLENNFKNYQDIKSLV